LQAAILRDEKAREAKEKRIARDLTRQITRERLAREKAEKQAAREAQRAQKAAETATRRQEAVEAKAQRVQAKNAIEKAAKSKKRPLDAEEPERPVKRPRTHASRSHVAANLGDSTSLPDTTMVQLANDAISTVDSLQSSSRMRNTEKRPISVQLRSGRNTRPPARFP
jgi:membrane protein involved in colicin uptake